MVHFDRRNRKALADARAHLQPPARRPVGLGHLLAAAAFAAVTALLSAAAIILGLPGIDRSAMKVETSVWGVMKTAPTSAKPKH